MEENIGVNFHDFGFGNGFLDMTPKAGAIKEKIDKLDFTKIKKFCESKVIIRKLKWQPIEWENITANHISDKSLISRVKNLYN